jgi:hypothetical protein
MEPNNRNSATVIIALIICSFVPFLFYCLLSKDVAAVPLYAWMGFGCAVIGFIFSAILQKKVKEPFNDLKSVSRLAGFPRTDFHAVLIRVGYTLSYIGVRLNIFWIVIFVLAKVFSLK